MLKRIWKTFSGIVRTYFVAGLLAFAPIGITVWAISWIITRLDNLLLPQVIQWVSPGLSQPPDLPPLVGALFTFLVILLAGVIVRHLFGHEVVRIWERLLSRVPIARTIYGGVKQLLDAVLQTGETNFNRVVLIEYPRKGLWALAFTTGHTRGPVANALPGRTMTNCFLPTTPNPTSGFYLAVPEDDITEIDLSVEDAFKVIMSAGLVTPGSTARRIRNPELPFPPTAPDTPEGPPASAEGDETR
jgi:uncharacterized membrane protein